MAAKFPSQADEIERLLVKFDLSAEELAEIAQLSAKTIYKYRKGYQRASEQIMQAIRNAAELHQNRRLASPGEVAAKGSSNRGSCR